jgi:hypothetical protein
MARMNPVRIVEDFWAAGWKARHTEAIDRIVLCAVVVILRQHKFPRQHIDRVCTSIALHTTPGYPSVQASGGSCSRNRPGTLNKTTSIAASNFGAVLKVSDIAVQRTTQGPRSVVPWTQRAVSRVASF